jgi:hypothetical protein
MILALAAVAALGMSALTSTSVLAFGRLGGLHAVQPQVRVAVSRPVVGRTINSINARGKIASGFNPDG